MKRYVQEVGTDLIRGLFRGRKELAVSRLTELEVTSALAKRARAGDLDLATAQRFAAELPRDLEELRVVEVRPPVLLLANALVWRHALRAYDALQLGSALRLANATGLALTFWCADERLSRAARDEGLRGREI